MGFGVWALGWVSYHRPDVSDGLSGTRKGHGSVFRIKFSLQRTTMGSRNLCDPSIIPATYSAGEQTKLEMLAGLWGMLGGLPANPGALQIRKTGFRAEGSKQTPKSSALSPEPYALNPKPKTAQIPVDSGTSYCSVKAQPMEVPKPETRGA